MHIIFLFTDLVLLHSWQLWGAVFLKFYTVHHSLFIVQYAVLFPPCTSLPRQALISVSCNCMRQTAETYSHTHTQPQEASTTWTNVSHTLGQTSVGHEPEVEPGIKQVNRNVLHSCTALGQQVYRGCSRTEDEIIHRGDLALKVAAPTSWLVYLAHSCCIL